MPLATRSSLGVEQVVAALQARRRFILVVGTLCFLAVIGATLVSRMHFEASGRLYLGELGADERGSPKGSEIEIGAGKEGDLGSEIAILTSESLLRQAVLDSGLNVEVNPKDWAPPRFWQWRLSGRDPALLEGGARHLRVVVTSVDDDLLLDERSYRVVFGSPTDYDVLPEEGSNVVASGTLGDPISLHGTTFALLAAVDGPSIETEYELTIRPLPETLDTVRRALEVGHPRPVAQNELPKVVSLEFEYGSPYAAANFLRTLMQGYLTERQDWKMEDATVAERFVSEQLQAMRRSLDSTEQKMVDYRAKTEGVVLEGEAEAMVEQIAHYEEQRVAAKLELAALADLKRALDRPDAPVEAYLFGEAADSVLQGMAESLTEARQELAELQTRFHAAAPNVQEQRGQVEAHLESIRRYIDGRLGRARANLATFNRIIDEYQEKLQTVPGAERGLTQLSRESEVYSRLYSYLLQQQQQAAIVKASSVSKNRILDLPRPPARESTPRLLLRLIGSLFGFIFAAGLVLIRRLTTDTLQSEAEARSLAPFASVLASVPVPEAEVQRSAHDTLLSEPYSGFAESFRLMRTNLYRMRHTGAGQIVLITSPAPGDGKTTSAMGLATMLAADGKRTLLIDADLRKPSHHELIRAGTRGPGLADLLAGRCRFAAAVQSHLTPLGAFDTISAGDGGDPESISDELVGDVLSYARLKYEFVVVDTAAFPLVADALVVAPNADVAISVLRIDSTPRSLATEHLERIRAHVRHHGLVLNAAGVGRPYGYARYPQYASTADVQSLTATTSGWTRLGGRVPPLRVGWIFAGAILGLGVWGGLATFWAEQPAPSRQEALEAAAQEPPPAVAAAASKPAPEPAGQAEEAAHQQTLPTDTTSGDAPKDGPPAEATADGSDGTSTELRPEPRKSEEAKSAGAGKEKRVRRRLAKDRAKRQHRAARQRRAAARAARKPSPVAEPPASAEVEAEPAAEPVSAEVEEPVGEPRVDWGASSPSSSPPFRPTHEDLPDNPF